MIDEVPAGMHSHAEKRALSERNSRADLHGLGDPADWGWRRPTPDELVLEHLDRILDEPG